jgi:NAD(P)H-flavin reductase/ferredoxin
MAMNTREICTATINGAVTSVYPGQTLLDAGLAAGIAMPFGCRVGGCGTCRCRLLDGRVRELTETAYLLEDIELASGIILACQSVPIGDVRVAFDVTSTAARRQVTGRVREQHRLTPSITRLVVELDQGLPYLPGQFAMLTVASLPGVTRSYSFATPPAAQPVVEFHVRHVPGGEFTGHVANCDLTGETVIVDGPLGDFALHAGERPLLFVTTSTGLAPVLAMLEAALKSGETRPVTLLHGARTHEDLHALDRLGRIARDWQGKFCFVPVLSQPDAKWKGARGRVTAHLTGRAGPDVDGYLCGAAAMTDDVASRLETLGLPRAQIRADRFTTQADPRAGGAALAAAPKMPLPMRRATPPEHASTVIAPTVDREASLLDYLKFFLFHAIGLCSIIAMLAGGQWTTAGLLAIVVFYVGGDALFGDDTSAPRFHHSRVLTLQLWLALPLVIWTVFTAVWTVSPGDPLGYGTWIQTVSGWDVLSARSTNHAGHHLSAFILTGLMIGMVGTIPAHELVHRTWDPISAAIGRALLAFSFDTVFAIEHVYGHHRYVATAADPATAPRGCNVYVHILRSTWLGNRSAWRIESRRLKRRGHRVLGWRNGVIRGHLASVALIGGAWAMGGWVAAGFFVASALWGKALLEIVNFMEHYGLVRDPLTPVAPRHSWNTNRRISSWSMFNLTRHSHHHAQGEVAYQNLRPFPDAPMMLGGYLTTIIVALLPPLWHRLMSPRLDAWDRDHATPTERHLALEGTWRQASRGANTPASARDQGART